MPDPRMSADQLQNRFKGIEYLQSRQDQEIQAIRKTNLTLQDTLTEKLEILSMRVEELEKELYGEC